MPTQRRRPRESERHSFPAPTAGLISNRNLATAASRQPGASVLRNFFPTATGCVLRRGLEQRADLTDTVVTMFSYLDGDVEELFAATSSTVYKIGVTPTPALTGKASGDWSVVQFSTAGGTFLIGVNGSDAAFVYNGTTWSATTIVFPSGAGLTTANLSHVWVHQQRLWFIEKDSMNAWYLPVDQIGGQLTLWPMGGVFVLGGTLQWGQAWSLASGGAGGLSDQCVFATTEGEVASYQGLSPDPDQGWEKVGTYRIGRPMGKHGFIRAGGDIIIASTVGFISLAAASQADIAALGRLAVSYSIEDEWAQAVRQRGEVGWKCEIWPDGQMILIVPPFSTNYPSVIFAVNSNTGAWGEFTGWDVTALRAFAGKIYVGQPSGTVAQAWVSGTDLGMPYVGEMMPLFTDCGAPASRKFPKLARVTFRAAYDLAERVTAKFEFNTDMPAAPNARPPTDAGVWGSGTWGTSLWGEDRAKKTISVWRGVGGSGDMVSLALQITSANAVPLDAEVIRLDMMYQGGDLVT